ncbi:MAG: transposase, partial [Alistipes sp.]|nr:transposase [Candidatus Alistipes equi]
YKKELHDYLYAETQKSELPDESAVVEIENFKKELRAHENDMLTFLTTDGVSPTNNAAEISLRSTKTKLKVSGNFRTEYGSYMYAVNGSIVQTAILNKENVYHKLLEIALKAETVDELAPWDQELLPLNTKTQSKQKGV